MELLDRTVRLTRLPQGIALYFPPLRARGAALALALFGLACLVPGVFAAFAVAPLLETGASGLLAIWLMSLFIIPFVVFGIVFLALAVYLAANSLTVRVTQAEIRTLRRVFGVAVRERRIAVSDIEKLEPVIVLSYRWPRDDVPIFSLVARTRSGAGLTMQEAWRSGRLAQFRDRNVTVAESLRGEGLMGQVRSEIVKAAHIAD